MDSVNGEGRISNWPSIIQSISISIGSANAGVIRKIENKNNSNHAYVNIQFFEFN